MTRGHDIGTMRRGRRLVATLLLAGLAAGLPACAPALSTPLALPLPEPLPPVRALTLLVGLHLVGLCFGLGGATMLDFWILRWMRWGGMPAEIERTFHFISKVVAVGIGLLWLSGIGFLALYAFEAPEKLGNPKLWAKITIVGVLTVNGALIHALVLPGVLRDVRRPMLHGVSPAQTGIFLASGAISGVSWYAAFALGLVREFNDRVSLGLLLALWISALAAACLGAAILWRHLGRTGTLRRAPFLPPLDEPERAPAARIPAHRMVAVRRPLGASASV
ncbi:hypothetical protein U8607_08505 [Methylobacterium durans]|uniref:hypothetical protein n=1 Tax=Methylobacterium durans TaxID=2202825 RepID=UPI002AFFA4EF|nr:hypothetical protein [Methylobacterium durans]MEA1832123.1 hypothetical protein [Methylobacterium durans]